MKRVRYTGQSTYREVQAGPDKILLPRGETIEVSNTVGDAIEAHNYPDVKVRDAPAQS